jgi:hypothetical protein
MTELIRHCPDCASEQAFEFGHPVPGGCPDVPDGECPEIWCTACGAALLAGPLPVPLPAAAGTAPAGTAPAGTAPAGTALRHRAA